MMKKPFVSEDITHPPFIYNEKANIL